MQEASWVHDQGLIYVKIGPSQDCTFWNHETCAQERGVSGGE